MSFSRAQPPSAGSGAFTGTAAGAKAWAKDPPSPAQATPLFFEANEPGASVAMLCWDDYNY